MTEQLAGALTKKAMGHNVVSVSEDDATIPWVTSLS